MEPTDKEEHVAEVVKPLAPIIERANVIRVLQKLRNELDYLKELPKKDPKIAMRIQSIEENIKGMKKAYIHVVTERCK